MVSGSVLAFVASSAFICQRTTFSFKRLFLFWLLWKRGIFQSKLPSSFSANGVPLFSGLAHYAYNIGSLNNSMDYASVNLRAPNSLNINKCQHANYHRVYLKQGAALRTTHHASELTRSPRAT